MKVKGKRPAAGGGTGAFPGRGPLIAWGERLYSAERPAVKPRIGVLRGATIEAIEAIELSPRVVEHGMDAVIQATAVLARTAGDDEPVFIFMFSNLEVRGPGLITVKRSGFADGYAAGLMARTRSGQKFMRFWQTESINRNQLRTLSNDARPEAFNSYPDWTSEDTWVDSALEDLLARENLPGALRQVRTKPSAMSLISAASNRSDVARLPVPPPKLPEPNEPRDLEFPWEAARADSLRLHHLGTHDLGWSPLTITPAALPVGLQDRSLDDLMKNGWTTPAQACHLARKIDRSDTATATLAGLLAGPIPAIAKMLGCAMAADLGFNARDISLIRFSTSELKRLVDEAVVAAGGLRPWLDAQWPAEPSFSDMLGTVAISSAANDAFWRIWISMVGEFVLPLAQDSDLARGFEHAGAVLDWILDRCRVTPGTRGARVAELARVVLHAVPSADGEPRIERWREAVCTRRGNEVPGLVLRDHAAVHAVVLHSVLVIQELCIARFVALGEPDPESTDDEPRPDIWHPEVMPTAGLLTHALDVLARHVLQRAATTAEPDEQLRLLERSHTIAPWDEAIGRSLNEALFRAERGDARLLGDLWKEANATNALAPLAEALAVATELGRQDVARSARRRLVSTAGNGPHAWIAAARAIFARPSELANAAAIRKVEALARPENLDPNDRAVRALYGTDPAATIAELTKALKAQRELVEWKEAEREERLEDAERGGPRGPDAPVRPADDAVGRASRALRARVERPRLAKTILRRSVERHTERALELTPSETEPVASGWLDAVRGFVGAADAELARDVAPDEAGLASLFELADAALDASLADAWGANLLRLTATLRPLIPRAGVRARELARRTASLEQGVADAMTPEARRAIDDDLRRLLGDAATISTTFEDDDAPEAGTKSAPESDAFRAMVAPPEALERSRRELDTPDWALTEALHQVTQFNLARGRRDLKLLKGTREAGTPIWELRHYDRRSGVRVLFVRASDAPRVCAVMAKVDDAQQNRVIERVKGWLNGGP